MYVLICIKCNTNSFKWSFAYIQNEPRADFADSIGLYVQLTWQFR